MSSNLQPLRAVRLVAEAAEIASPLPVEPFGRERISLLANLLQRAAEQAFLLRGEFGHIGDTDPFCRYLCSDIEDAQASLKDVIRECRI